jgi:murein L,D-transpeptidase YcbB/YkuD
VLFFVSLSKAKAIMKSYYLIFLSLLLLGCKQKSLSFTSTPSPFFLLIKDFIITPDIDSIEVNSYNNPDLSAFYESRGYKKAWIEENIRKEIILVLEKVEEEGLNPADYDLDQLKKYETNFSTLSDSEKNTYDIAFTHSLQRYISHLSNGKLKPNVLYSDWEIKENKVDVNAIVMGLENGNSITEKLNSLKPTHLVYLRLKKALKIINSLNDDSFSPIVIKDKIIPKTTHPQIVEIKKKLLYWGDLKKKEKKTAISPVYDSETVMAIKRFQIRHGLTSDGVIGAGTVTALNFTKDERREQIIANLERWKWYPRNMGKEHIIINIPDYQLYFIKEKDTLRMHKVVVGRPERPTPILSSLLTQVIFNPTWTVPPTILKEDLIPDIKRNRYYLTKNKITIYDQAGNTISPRNWKSDNAFNYKYVQKPSRNNSLGVVKLNFSNRFSVYLHDTNHRELFVLTRRSLSSGCVRLENPVALTQQILNDTVKWNNEKIDALIETAKTTYVKIKNEVPIHLLYWTAWSNKNKLIFREDIYNRDKELYTMLRN